MNTTNPAEIPLFADIPHDAAEILNALESFIKQARPLGSRQRQNLPADIQKLFHHMTDSKGLRRTGYMNETTALTAYIYYYYWWNLIRFTHLFAGMKEGAIVPPTREPAVCVDFGSGPLTVITALWLARPELRSREMTWYCVDYSSNALEAGMELFYTCAAHTMDKQSERLPWQIIRVKGTFGTGIRRKAHFISCANTFNEILQASEKQPQALAKYYAGILDSYTCQSASENARICIIEPGIPHTARFVSHMRSSLMRRGYAPVSPCTHTEECPMDGRKKGKWCHFVLPGSAAPKALQKLSEKAGLEKDRASLSFILVGKNGAKSKERSESPLLQIRIASDPIRLPGNRTGYYGCSSLGMILLIQERNRTAAIPSGTAVSCRMPAPDAQDSRDAKTGARIIYMDSGHKTQSI